MLKRTYDQVSLPLSVNDHYIGNKKAPIVIIEYGDFQCPYSANSNNFMKRLFGEYKKELLYVFRHFPLTKQHANALIAAEAAEIASEYGKYWEMHNMIFENQEHLNCVELILFAEDLGIDGEEFAKKLSNEEALPKVEADIQMGTLMGVSRTPTYFINDEKTERPPSIEDIAKKHPIQSAL